MKIILTILFLLSSINAHSKTDVMFVTPAQINDLEAMYKSAKTPGAEINNTRWNCHLYGKRSLTYKKRPVVLYDLKKTSEGHYKNSGSHVTKAYEATTQGLVGKRSTLIDTVRITNKNILVSKLTLDTGTTVSYSVCRN